MIKFCQPVAIEKELTLALFIDEDIPEYLIGDSDRIYRIVLELIINVLKFTKKRACKCFLQHLERNLEEKLLLKLLLKILVLAFQLKNSKIFLFALNAWHFPNEGIYKGIGLGLSIVK